MNAREEAVRLRMQQQGWSVLRGGWPDFLCIRRQRGRVEVRAVEVKSEVDKVTPHQEKIHEVLAKVGVRTDVITEEGESVPSCITLSARVSVEICRELEVLAKSQRRSVGQYLRILIEDHVTKKEKT